MGALSSDNPPVMIGVTVNVGAAPSCDAAAASETYGCADSEKCNGCDNYASGCETGKTLTIGVEGSPASESPVINIPTGVAAGPQSFNFELPSGVQTRLYMMANGSKIVPANGCCLRFGAPYSM